MKKLTASGFSLIELMIALALLGVVGVGIGFAYNGFLQNRIITEARAELRFDSGIIVKQLRHRFNRADGITLAQVGDNATCLVINTPTNSTKTAYRFAPSTTAEALNQLWVLEYSDSSASRCEPPSPDTGWQLFHPSDWLITAQPPFSLSDGTVTIHAELVRQIGTRILSATSSFVFVPAAHRQHLSLCKIAPAISGFDTGGGASAEAVIRFDNNSFEAGVDALGFTDATPTAGDNASLDTFKAIRAGGTVIWPNITADFNHASGVMRICTTTGDSCTTPDNATPDNTTHGIDDWYKVLREVIYTTSPRPSPHEVIVHKNLSISLGGVLTKRIVIDANAFIKNCR